MATPASSIWGRPASLQSAPILVRFFLRSSVLIFGCFCLLPDSFAALVGLIVALPTLKLQGIYLAIVTLGASEIIRIIAQTWTPVTGGSLGIKNIPYPWLFSLDTFRPKYYYFIFLVIAILFYFVTSRVLKSRVGRAWISIRRGPDRRTLPGRGNELLQELELHVRRVLGRWWSARHTPRSSTISKPRSSRWDTGFNVLAMVVIGGQGTLIGPARRQRDCNRAHRNAALFGSLALRDLCRDYHPDDVDAPAGHRGELRTRCWPAEKSSVRRPKGGIVKQ